MDRSSTRIEQEDPSLILSRALIRRSTLLLRAPDGSTALEIDFFALQSENGFRRIAQVQLTLTEATPDGPRIQNLRSSEDAKITPADLAFRLSSASLENQNSQGQISARGKSVQWQLKFSEPNPLQTAQALKASSAATRSLVFEGTLSWAGQNFSITNWVGVRLDYEAPYLPRASARIWASGFKNDRGMQIDASIAAMMAQFPVLGIITSPKLTAVSFEFGGKAYQSSTPWKMLRNAAQNFSEEGWSFRTDFGSIAVQVDLKGAARDFCASTLEDTDGSQIERRVALRCPVRVVVYRDGKLENTLSGLAFFETLQKI